MKYLHPTKYLNHLPHAKDGVEGVHALLAKLPPSSGQSTVVRSFEDGPYVFTHAIRDFFGSKVFFDIFRLEDGYIVEHWAASTSVAPANESGHTQIDGPTKAESLGETEKNKDLVREFCERCFISGEFDQIPQYFEGNHFIRHDEDGGDGLQEFLALMKARAEQGFTLEIEELKFVLGHGNFVLTAAKGTAGGNASVFYDLFRVANGKIAEHWGIIEHLPPRAEWKNLNGAL